MYDVQKYEQPPADIIKDLAPGLKFDENGMCMYFIIYHLHNTIYFCQIFI